MVKVKSFIFGAILGFASLAQAEVFEQNLDFGFLNVGASRTQTLSLQNNASQSLTIVKWSITGGSFSASTNCPSKLAPGMSCQYLVRFDCYREGPESGLLRIVTSKDEYRVHLHGLGNRVVYPEPRPPVPRP